MMTTKTNTTKKIITTPVLTTNFIERDLYDL